MIDFLKLEHIEVFDGSVPKLKSFVEIVDLFHKIQKIEKNDESDFLTVIIHCKLSDNIKCLINDNIFKSWNDLKIFLKDKLQPKMENIVLMYFNIIELQQKRNESLLEYIDRLNDKFKQFKELLAFSDCKEAFPDFEKTIISKIKDTLPLNTFIILNSASTLDELKQILDQKDLGHHKTYGKFLPLSERARKEWSNEKQNHNNHCKSKINFKHQYYVPQNYYSNYKSTNNVPFQNRNQNNCWRNKHYSNNYNSNQLIKQLPQNFNPNFQYSEKKYSKFNNNISLTNKNTQQYDGKENKSSIKIMKVEPPLKNENSFVKHKTSITNGQKYQNSYRQNSESKIHELNKSNAKRKMENNKYMETVYAPNKCQKQNNEPRNSLENVMDELQKRLIFYENFVEI